MKTTIGFENIIFKEKDETTLRVLFYERYYFEVALEELKHLGAFNIVKGDLAFVNCSEKKATNKLSHLIDIGLQNLKHILYNKPTFYIHRGSGVPLIGSNEFGVIDRGSNILEIKPNTGCNFNCPYCSVDEGKNEKTHDYVVEMEYIVEVTRFIAAKKKHPVECNIGPQGEPIIYPKIVELIAGLQSIPQVKVVSINTNGSLLSKALIDRLANAGLTRINLSLNAVTQETANKMSGTAYPIEKTLEMIKYCGEKEDPKISVLLAPTLVPGFNEDEIEGLVKISKGIKSEYPTIGIQNFLHYPKGRNPAKSWEWKKFYTFIKDLEEKTEKTLKADMKDFGIVNEPELEKPFTKGQTIQAHISGPGRYPKELLATAGSGNNARTITIINARNEPMGREVKVKLIRDKHNIYKGRIV